MIAHAKVTYLEGYLWDPPAAKAAFLKAAKVARDAGRKVALSLSDAFCVERHRAEFRDLVSQHVDILFANEAEICSLWQVDSFDAALQATRGKCEIAALTRSAEGSVILAGQEVHVVDAAPVHPGRRHDGCRRSLRRRISLRSVPAGASLMIAGASARSPPPR